VSSEGGGGIPNIPILGATAFDDLLASELVVGTFCLRVGDCRGLPGATVEGMVSEIGPRRRTGEQGAAAVVQAEEHPGGNLE
jgi:hypothetical protein